MEEKIISLLKLDPPFQLTNSTRATLSYRLDHLCVTSPEGHLFVYSLSTQEVECYHLLWESSSPIYSFRFSDDGKYLLVVLQTRSVQIYSLSNSKVNLIVEIDPLQLNSLLECVTTDMKTADMKTVSFSSTQLILLVERKWMFSVVLKLTEQLEPLTIKIVTHFSSLVALQKCKQYAYCLTAGGSLSYSLESGKQVASVNLHSLKHGSADGKALDIFTDLAVSEEGSFVAVSDANGKIYFAKLEDLFCSYISEEGRYKDDDASSTVSVSSGTSFTSISTAISQRRIPSSSAGDSISICTMVIPERKRLSLVSLWHSYLASLKSPSAEIGPVRRHSKINATEVMRTLDTSSIPENLSVRNLHIMAAGIVLWYAETYSWRGGLYQLYSITTGKIIAEFLIPKDTLVIPGGYLGIMDAFLSPTSLWLFLGHLSKELVITKLLNCMDTKSIHRLQHAGEWKDLMVPLPALTEGLKHQQLDVAKLALTLHSEAFRSSFCKITAETYIIWQTRVQRLSLQMEELFGAAHETLKRSSQMSSFMEQLTLLYLQHGNDLLQFLCEVDNRDALVEKRVNLMMKQIMMHVAQLRGYLRRASEETSLIGDFYQLLESLDQHSKAQWSLWQNMEDEEIILDAAFKDKIQLLETFLHKCRGWKAENILHRIRKYASISLKDLLRSGEIKKAEKLLMNLGTDPHEELKGICMQSSDSNLRDNLAKYLSQNGLLAAVELEAWNFIRLIENIIQAAPPSMGKCSMKDIPPYPRLIPTLDVPEKCKNYSHLSLNSILKQSLDWRTKVLVELYLNTSEAELEKFIEAKSLWQYLLHINKEDALLCWISSFYSKYEERSDAACTSKPQSHCNSRSSLLLKPEIQRVFSGWEITQHMIDLIHGAYSMKTTKEKLLDYLSRHGAFSTTEQQNPNLILARLCRTKNLVLLKTILNQPSANVSYVLFQELFIKCCIQLEFHNIFFSCLQNLNLSEERVEHMFESLPIKDKQKHKWFTFFLKMKDLKDNWNSELLIYEAINIMVNCVSNEENKAYLGGHPLVVLALILYGKKQISKILKTEDVGEFIVGPEVLHTALEQLPVLKMALTYQKHGLSQQPSVSVYHLLQDSSPFSVAKVFSWQEENRCKAGEYPHFSSEKLVSKYGHKEILTFLYYLRQEQPSFAVNMFVIDQLKTHKRISKRARKHACNLAHGLALKNFTKENIVCSCISFIEMLGADSGSVKVHVAVANKILNGFTSSLLENTEKNGNHQAKISHLLYGLVQKDASVAYEVLNLLETTLLHSISTRRNSTVVENILHWNIAVKFAKLHGICLPGLFLRECAKTNEWLTFILFIYIHRYPLQQVMQLIKEFSSNKLQDHLKYAVSHLKEEQIRKLKENSRDARNVLYSRLQLHKGGAKNSSLIESPSADVGAARLASSSSEDEFQQSRKLAVGDVEVAIFDTNGDIFHTLLTCHRSQDPPQALLTACHMLHNPLLAVLATCYEPSSLLACFCTWLTTSLTTYTDDDQMLSFRSALEEQIWSAEQLEQLLQQAVRDQCVSVLSRGFQLFFPNNPLCAFSIFLNECVQKKNFKESAIFMKAFKAGYMNIKNCVVAINYDMDGAFLNSAQWIASVVVNMACLTLAKCFSSSFHQLQFLGILCDTSFADFLTVQSVNFNLLHQLGECLSGTGIVPEWSSLCCVGEKCNQELMWCVDKLIEVRRYQQALDFAILAGLSKENIIIAQWNDLFQEDASKLKCKQKDDSHYFWYMCNTAFVEANVKPKTAFKFFRDHSEKVCNFIERFHVLRLALNWLRSCDDLSFQKINSNPKEKLILEKTEMEMWKCLLVSKAELEHIPTEILVPDKPRLIQCLKEELLVSSGASSLTLHEAVNDKEQLNCLNLLIERLLDEGDIYTACRLESIFNHSSQDVQLLLTCMDLAEGTISHHQLAAQQRALLIETNSAQSGLLKRRARQSLKHTSLPSSQVSSQSDSLEQSSNSDVSETSILEKQDILLTLEKLLEHVQHGKQIGNRIICCYRAALSLDRTYQEIITLEDPMSLLKTIPAGPHLSKIMVASDLISAAQTSSEQIAELLCEAVVTAVSKDHIQDDVFEGVTIWGSDAEQNFHLFIELCDDPSILGTKLLNVATHIGATQPDAIKEVVEILVRAHDCYTAACNMEGIAAVLQLAQTLTESLLLRQEWALMVRLLTGIGRYTEMNYIFQILKNNEQFEFLLGKGLDKKSNLKLAVVDFLKQYCPEDRELFRLVALHFTMYGEVAILWENEGQEVMNILINHTRLKQPTMPTLLANTEDTKKLLNTIMVNFTHAAEYFIQAKKLNRAMAAAHQAELVALQISQIASVPPGQETDCLLQLEPTEVDNLIINKLSFPQACLIARAYSHPVDWGAALYQQCIIQAKTTYLSEFMYSMTLTTALVEDVARRFQRETEVTTEMAAQMKKFVLAVLNVEVKYRIASQLGFRDVIESLLTGPELPYLKDTVWRSGFTSRHYPS